MGGSLDRGAFGKPVFKSEKVELPGRGGSVTVREMTSGDALAFFTGITAEGKQAAGSPPPALWLAHRCVVTDGGERVFKSPEDVGECLTRDELVAINAAVSRVNGMDGEPEKKSGTPSTAG